MVDNNTSDRKKQTPPPPEESKNDTPPPASGSPDKKEEEEEFGSNYAFGQFLRRRVCASRCDGSGCGCQKEDRRRRGIQQLLKAGGYKLLNLGRAVCRGQGRLDV